MSQCRLAVPVDHAFCADPDIPMAVVENAGKPIIVIDPGHGGVDPGAIYVVSESYLNLKIGLLTRNVLSPQYNVILTRDADAGISVGRRVQIANDAEANILVSIHCNAAVNHEASGFEILHYPSSVWGVMLATEIKQAAIRVFGNTLRTRGLSARPNLGVLRDSRCPAVLVECGFMSNPRDLELLESDKIQTDWAWAIRDGVAHYFARRGVQGEGHG
jgi:N-acetylmuramoyl-L-alanine amidase